MGSDRVGGDIPHPHGQVKLRATDDASACAQRCLDTAGCVAWVFDPSPPSAPTCSLKSELTLVSAHSTRTSGTVSPGLLPPAYPKLPASAFQPEGWLKTQIVLQNEGLAGHLQLFWADVAQSEFIGGKADTMATNHERFVYWLNGQITQGYLGQNESMSATVWNYTNYLLTHQRADGWLGPEGNYDPWPRMMILYIFQQYHEINGSDERVIPAMFRYCDFLWAQYTNSSFRPEQYSWNYVRIQDMLTSIQWLYDTSADADQQQFLLDLSEVLYNKSADWKAYYRSDAFPHDDVGNRGTMLTHGVNSGMALKSAAVWYRQSRDKDDMDSSYERLAQMDQYHGQASGIFSCDEHLAGKNPSRGTEMCTVVEAMFSSAPATINQHHH